MMKKLSVAVVSSFVFGALTVRAADTWYLKQTMGAKEYAAMSDPSYWVDASGSTVCPAMNTTDTYVVGDGYRLSCNSSYTFAGVPLVIGKDLKKMKPVRIARSPFAARIVSGLS